MTASEKAILTLDEARKIKDPIVYGLSDCAGVIFYIGQTRNAARRFYAHVKAITTNRRLKSRILELGSSLRVVILHMRPGDLNEAERSEIAAREGQIINLIGADSDVWGEHSSVPWAAGSGVKCPSSYALKLADHDGKTLVRAHTAKMSDAERCAFEIGIMMDLPAPLQRRHDKWLSIAGPKMIRCMEAHQLGLSHG